MKEVFGDSDDDGAPGGGGGGDDARRKGRFKYDVHNILTPICTRSLVYKGCMKNSTSLIP